MKGPIYLTSRPSECSHNAFAEWHFRPLACVKITMNGVSVAVSEARPELGLLGVRAVEWAGGVPLVPSRIAQRLDLVLDSNQVC